MSGESSINSIIETEQFNIAGQNAAIRRGNPEDPTDIAKLSEIFQSPGYKEYFSNPDSMTKETVLAILGADPIADLEEILVGKSKKGYANFIVSGSTNNPNSNTGELQGIVGLSNYGSIRNGNKYPRLELTWNKHPEAPTKQMAAGVRSILWEIFKRTTTVKEITQSTNADGMLKTTTLSYDNLDSPNPTEIVTTEINNAAVGSESVSSPKLEFETPIEVWVYIRPGNTASMELARNAGFVLYDSDTAMYKLDWHRFLHRLNETKKPPTQIPNSKNSLPTSSLKLP